MRLLKLNEACAKLGVSISKFYAMIEDGTVPAPVKMGHSSRWPEDEIDAAIRRLIEARDATHGRAGKAEERDGVAA